MEKVCVGVDVSAQQLEVAYRIQGRLIRRTVPNDSSGHKQLIGELQKLGPSVRVAIEATGVYGIDLALALDQAERIELMVANPRAVNNFAKSLLQRTKTDRTDALVILEFVQRMPFIAWQRPSNHAFALRAVSRRIYAINDMIRKEKNRDHAADHLEALPKQVARSITRTVRHLEREIEQLRKAALDIIQSDADLVHQYDLLLSIKGVGSASAISILGELALIAPDMTARQWVAHAGLDPRLHDSGTSVHKQPRISKQGNKHLRAALYLPAVVAANCEPAVTLFRNELLLRGKKTRQIHIAIMRKLLHAIHGMFAHNQPWDPARFRRCAA